jgi:hypothetical protein
MKLDRNIVPFRGKYALIKLRVRDAIPGVNSKRDIVTDHVLVNKDAIDFGDSDATDFFVIRLKDKYAEPALRAYAAAARFDDAEYANEVEALANLAAKHPSKRKPD